MEGRGFGKAIRTPGARVIGIALLLGSVLLTVPAGAAQAIVDELPSPGIGDAIPSIQEGLSTLNQKAEDATGQESPLPKSPPAVVPPPDSTVGWGAESIIPVAVAGLAGLGLVGSAIYLGTRYVTREDVLKNDVRARIMAHLRERTGANLKQITEDLGLTNTNAIWHLRKLEDAGLVHSRRFNGYKVFYPAEGGVQARRMSLSVAALVNGNAKDVFEFVVAHPGAHQREIARALGVNHGTVRWHLKKLRRAELLHELRVGKTSTYHATEMGVTALRTVARHQPAAHVHAATAASVTRVSGNVEFAASAPVHDMLGGASPSRGVSHRP